MKYDDNNIFAKILRGEIPCKKIYEDDFILSFHDLNPQKKILQNCKTIFLSPIFYIKKKKNFLGLHKFNFISYRNNIKILPLGGISKNNIPMLKLLNAKGFGGIRIFKKKPASKGRFS